MAKDRKILTDSVGVPSIMDKLSGFAESIQWEVERLEEIPNCSTFAQFLRRFTSAYWTAMKGGEKYSALSSWRQIVDNAAKFFKAPYVSEVLKAVLDLEESDELPTVIKKVRKDGKIGYLNEYCESLRYLAIRSRKA